MDNRDENRVIPKVTNKFSYLSPEEMKSISLWILRIENLQAIIEMQERTVHLERAIKTLRLKYKKIGNGGQRIVFDLNNGYVLKVALNGRGVESNKREWQLFFSSPPHIRKHLCPVERCGHGWIIMKNMTSQLMSVKAYDKKKIERLIKKFKKNGITPQDTKIDNLALTKNGTIIVLDYGNFI